MNRDELTLRKDLSESNEWDFIRDKLLQICIAQSANETFCEKYSRGVLYAIKTVDEWADAYYRAVEKDKQMKGES